MEAAKPILKKEGYDLEVKIVNDYVTPNKLVFDGDADANFFQHTPYLDKFNKENNENLVSVGNVHIEPMALYSKKYKSIKDLPNDAVVYASTNPAEVGRFIDLFVKNGLMKIKDGVDPVDAQLKDIVENPKNIQIKQRLLQNCWYKPITMMKEMQLLSTQTLLLMRSFLQSRTLLLLRIVNRHMQI